MPNNPPPRSHKAWVRKHQPIYWEVWFGKGKNKDKDNSNYEIRERGHANDGGDRYDERSMRSEQGSSSRGGGGGRRLNDDYYNNNNNNNNNSEQGTYANDNSPPHRIASSHSGRTERSDYPPSLPRSDFPSFENHAGASTRAPPASSRGKRNLREEEGEEQVRMGGQTNAPGEMPRGAVDQDGGLVSEIGSRNEGGGSGGEGGMEMEEHPWYPRTTKYREEKTRRR